MSEYYYVDIDGKQLGPVNEIDLKSVFSSKKINKESLVWNTDIVNWTPIQDVPGLLNKIEPKKVVLPPPINKSEPAVADKSIVSSAALAAKARAEAIKNKNNPTSNTESSNAGFVNAKANIAAVLGGNINTNVEKKRGGSVIKELPSAKPEADWVELSTADGQKYYFNKALNLTQWDKPDCLKTIEESDKDVF